MAYSGGHHVPSDALYNFVSRHTDTYPAIDPLKANLSGRSVVITGASKGVGRETALSFAKAGCSRIAISARSSLSTLEQEISKVAKEAGRPEPLVVSMAVDVTKEDDVKKFVELVGEKFDGKIDVLINNAGYLEEWLPFAQTKPDEWWRTWDVNIHGLHLVSRYFIPLVLASDLKTIINISSNGAHNTSPGASAYQSSKFVVCRLSEFMSVDHGEEGLIAIALHPGGVMTELAKGMPDFMHKVLVDTPRLGADYMVWLAGSRKEWLAGRFVAVNWDVEELEKKKSEIVEGNLLKFRCII